ncbi:hypothetical protein Ahy_B06g083750 [Arachis hypogaea]|uniref:Uncharacterized protein n=1 Tax=Arachis hypogaea TaxID=3818 RepID=A0A444YQL8_ARAHY|nr:hypothetical protein Ahy_B06g083750 [Arachis hypogaea]
MIHFKNARSRCYVSLSKSKEVKIATKVDLAELKKGPPYICSLLKKITSVDRANDMKYKSGKNQIFDALFRDKQLALSEDNSLFSIKDLKEKPYCKIHQATSHSTNNCVCFRDLIQKGIIEGRLKFDDGKKDMRVDTDPFDVGPIFLGINMVGFTYEFDTTLGDFETNVRLVYPGDGEGLLEFLMQQRLKDRNVSLCPRSNVVFDAEAAVIFEKEKMKELAHKEEQIRQRHPLDDKMDRVCEVLKKILFLHLIVHKL